MHTDLRVSNVPFLEEHRRTVGVFVDLAPSDEENLV